MRRRFISSRSGQALQLQETVTVIADVSSPEELQAVTPTVATLQPGRRGQIVVQGFGLGLLGDLAGAEFVWQTFFAPAGIETVDVHGEGFSTVVVDWRIPKAALAGQALAGMGIGPVAVVALIGAAALALFALGWVISRITVLLFGPEGGGAFNFLVIGLIAIGGVLVLSSVGGKRGRS